jgi:endonuclease/exonuclease/phosphatase family metal-dependent hydrolase
MRFIRGFLPALFGVVLPLTIASSASAGEMKVMSYNIRYGTAQDGVNHWDKRKAWLTETVKAYDPDLLGTQETVGFQRDYLAEQLPTYGVLGVGRDDGKEKGEMMAVYWKKDRFEKIDGGHFWLSETPDVAGSKSWDSSLPRMATWVKLRDRKDDAAKPVLWINTHFDHRGPRARIEAAKIIRDKAESLGKGCSMLITGDFNSAEGSEPYKALFAKVGDKDSPVVDTYRVAHPNRGANEGTANGFKASATTGNRIDWIAASRDWTVKSAAIDRTSKDGRTPSDHWPIIAVLGR